MKPAFLPGRRFAVISCFAISAMALSACGPSEPVSEGAPPDIHRLTEEQYRNVIADVFGTSIIVSGRFDTPVRTEGLLAVGSRKSTVTAAGLAQYDEMARSIASQVLSEPKRRFILPCEITDQTEFDETCTTRFISKIGHLLFRRPLTQDELSSRVNIVRETSDSLDSFNEGLATGLASMLVSPQFLFVADTLEDDPTQPGTSRLDAYSKASKLSFFLWNTSPDYSLLAAAESGELHDDRELEQQVERLIASPRFKDGIRSFFSDMLEFSEFDFLEKDSLIYPAFGAGVIRDTQEQTLRMIADHVVNKDADYRDLFTTRDTFMTRSLGLVYRLPVSAPAGVWEPYQFAMDDPRVGIQGQLSFLALNSHPGRSSPTLRGKAIRNMLLCQDVPDPPPDVDFSGFNDPNSPNKTARDRLTAHSTSPACAGCHRITDPIGLALENYDGAGQFRVEEDGAPIDTRGDLDGIGFTDSAGLGTALHSNPATTKCLVNRLYAYASGHSMSSRSEWIAYLEESFAAEGYSVTGLIKKIAKSKSFYAVKPSDPVVQGIETAAYADITE